MCSNLLRQSAPRITRRTAAQLGRLHDVYILRLDPAIGQHTPNPREQLLRLGGLSIQDQHYMVAGDERLPQRRIIERLLDRPRHRRRDVDESRRRSNGPHEQVPIDAALKAPVAAVGELEVFERHLGRVGRRASARLQSGGAYALSSGCVERRKFSSGL